ncbi:MAG TPA: response regulator, partial [Thermodesulfobacteriaceae bacterium]|nr:response regulator [Thermodesulfobacteriaceae bacterium]
MNSIPGLKNRQKKKIRILIVDDSPVIRKIFTVMLGGEPDMEVVAAVPDPYVARDLIVREEPDVILLDIQMPRMDGLTFLRKLMKYFPVPVIIISSFTRNNSGLAMEAVETGAVDVLAKPDGSYTSSDLRLQLAHKIRAAARVDVKANLKRKTAPPSPSSMPESNDRLFRVAHKIIAIGASTGGTDALTQVITAIPVNSPGIVMVQHMPAGFTHSFAERLNVLSRVRVK